MKVDPNVSLNRFLNIIKECYLCLAKKIATQIDQITLSWREITVAIDPRLSLEEILEFTRTKNLKLSRTLSSLDEA